MIILIPAKVSELRIKLTYAFCYVAHVVEMSDGQSTFVLNVSQAGNTYLLLLVGNPYWQLHGQHPCFFELVVIHGVAFFGGADFVQVRSLAHAQLFCVSKAFTAERIAPGRCTCSC
jgi:hypothetical protein